MYCTMYLHNNTNEPIAEDILLPFSVILETLWLRMYSEPAWSREALLALYTSSVSKSCINTLALQEE